MIRVLQVVTHMNRGGLETMIMNYYRNIDRKKVQFDFLVHRPYEADYDQEIKSLGGRIYHISRLVPWSKKYKNELKKFLCDHPEYKIIHVHQDCLSSVVLQCAKECKIPVRIAHSHSASQDKNLKYLIKLYYRRFIPKYATDLLACGEDAGKWMFSGKQFQVLRNAIDVKKYDYNSTVRENTRKEFDLENMTVIGHVGRFSTVKNHKFLIDVFEECLKENKNIRLLLVGDGEEKELIEKKVKDMGLQGKVIFAGIRSDVNRIMQAMDVFVFPSLYEGLPLTLVEAQAAGLPCVISENIPRDCILTKNLITALSLKKSAKDWAEKILSVKDIKRASHMEELNNSGYDIGSNVKKLQEFYLMNEEK